MYHLLRPTFRQTLFLLTATIILSARAEEAGPISPKELAAGLSANVQDGSSSVRVRLEIRAAAAGPKTVLQLQIEARRVKTSTDVIYLVLWPKERKGESILLQSKNDNAPSGTWFMPPDSVRPITSSQMSEAAFGSNLSYADLIENFFAWEQQSIVGTEIVDRVSCQILESRPGKGDRSVYGRVLSWIDPKRLIPLRVEKYLGSGQLARRMETTRVAEDDTGRKIPASLEVRCPGQGSVTELEGSKIRHDVAHSDDDFTIEALREKSAQPSKPK